MSDWKDDLLPEGCREAIRGLLQSWSNTTTYDSDQLIEWILENSALCRLAFASLKGSSGDFPKPTMRAESVISVTQPELPTGRPSTRRWAFWAGYILRQQLNGDGQPRPPYKFVSQLIAILLERSEISTEETQIEFVKLRKTTKERAIAMAKQMLADGLKQDLTADEFARGFLDSFNDLAPTALMPPIIEHGKINEQWLQGLLQTRSVILEYVKKHGPLAGEEPVVATDAIKRLGSMSFDDSSNLAGVLHLGKAKEIPIPRPPAAGMTVSRTFPRSHIEGPPQAAQLYALPAWAHAWHAHFVARPSSDK